MDYMVTLKPSINGFKQQFKVFADNAKAAKEKAFNRLKPEERTLKISVRRIAG